MGKSGDTLRCGLKLLGKVRRHPDKPRPFEVRSFLFRLIAGLFFSALYLLRGFGITAWTHALYDVFLLTG